MEEVLDLTPNLTKKNADRRHPLSVDGEGAGGEVEL